MHGQAGLSSVALPQNLIGGPLGLGQLPQTLRPPLFICQTLLRLPQPIQQAACLGDS
jgi:hypothetical protein